MSNDKPKSTKYRPSLYIQPLETCLAFSCPLILCSSISCQATSCLANLSKFVFHFHVRQFYAWTLGPSISKTSNLCLDILMVRHFHVSHFQRPRPQQIAKSSPCIKCTIFRIITRDTENRRLYTPVELDWPIGDRSRGQRSVRPYDVTGHTISVYLRMPACSRCIHTLTGGRQLKTTNDKKHLIQKSFLAE